jgi:PAS domain S-box-containing protein
VDLVAETQLIEVLLVEDSPTDAIFAHEALQDTSRFRIHHVRTLREALASLSGRTFSVILLDLGLPDSQGLETLAKIHGHAPSVPVIVLTARNDEELAVDSANSGANEYLVKGELQEGILRRTIRHVVERDRSENVLRESTGRLRAIINTTPHCIKVVSAEGTVLEINAAGLRLLEADAPEAVIGRSVYPLIAAEYLDRYRAFQQAVCRGQPGVLEFEILGMHGTRRSMESVAVPLPAPDGSMLYLAIAQDVTDSKQVDAELRRTSELLRALANSTSDAVFVKDLEGRYLLFNPAAATFVGKTVDEVLGCDDRSLFEPDEARTVMANDRWIMESGRTTSTEEVLTSAGVSRTFLATKSPYRDDQGKVIGLLGISRDISDRKRLEAERDRVAARLRLQVERMPLACLLLDAKLRIVDWNPAAEHIFGYGKDEVVGMGLPNEKLVPPHSLPQARAMYDQVLVGDMAAHASIENLTRDGRTITCEWHNTPLFDDDTFLGVVALAQDVTARQLAEKTLEMRDRAIQAVSQGIVITDCNQPDGHIIYASPGFERLTGYTQAEVLGRNCRFMQGPETDPNAVSVLRTAIRHGESSTVELLNYRRDGTEFWCEVRISPLHDATGQVTHFVGTIADVSERRALEAQLRQSQKLEAVGLLAGGIAHDFNNLLTVIIGSCDALRSEAALTALGREAIRDIDEVAQRATSLTGQLLAFSRQQLLEPVVLSVNEIITSLNSMLSRLIKEDIALSCRLFPAIWPVRLDPGQVGQVIVNLIVNARDAMPQGGILSIESSNVEWTEADCRTFPDRKPGRYVKIVVADTGSGIPAENIAHMFEPFFTTKEAGKGTGLGLAVVHGVVKQSGGHIEVRSELNVGTSMVLYFPAVEEPISPTFEPSTKSENRGMETILLVEDQAGVRRICKRALERQGYTVLEASNGLNALEVAESNHGRLHLIVTDMVMPELGGRELVERLRPNFPGAKVLFMTGYIDDLTARNEMHDSFPALLRKPFSPSALVEKVREVLDADLDMAIPV